MNIRHGIMRVRGTVTVNFDTVQDRETLYESINDCFVRNGIVDFETRETSFAEPDDLYEGEMEVDFSANLPCTHTHEAGKRGYYGGCPSSDRYSADDIDFRFEIPLCTVVISASDEEFEECAV